IAGPSHSQTINLIGFLDVPVSAYNTDVWGWVDPVTDMEYALVGNNATGLHIVDVCDPENPAIVKTIPTIPSFDIKTWGHYMYTVDGNYGFNGSDGAIVDIADPNNPVVVGNIPPGHNIFVDDLGYMYLTFPGLKIFDLNPDPTNPQLVWEKVSTEGHDVAVVGDRLYDFHGHDGTFIYDVTNRADPVLLGSITDTTIIFHHSGWSSADDNYLFITDEFSFHPAPDIIVFDISDPSLPVRAAEIADSTATAHNAYRIDHLLYVSYYTSGFRVFDISDPTEPVLADEYDTTPLSSEGIFKGAWGCYPFAPSGNIYVNDRPEGFFVFVLDSTVTGVVSDPPSSFVLQHNYPNPFNPTTTIDYDVPASGGHVTLLIYDVSGRLVRTMVNGTQTPGRKTVTWDGRSNRGQMVATGVYFYRMTAPGFAKTRKMVMMK
ncbi:MAG: choice-of-anchor B family protein, partial [Candidatus Krumholzibacteria bacterium]|nr:choice-of-anchor B family protein [Candidatus Krumholzibacteria bacterium]